MLREVLMTKISITKKDLKNLYKGKNIIDIRPNYEYQYGSIPNAINIQAIKLKNI